MISRRTLLVLIAIFGVLYWLNIKGSSSFISDKIRIFVLNTKDNLVFAYQKHFNQARLLEEDRRQLKAYENLKLAYANLNARNQALALELDDLQELEQIDQEALRASPLTPPYTPKDCAPNAQLIDPAHLLPAPTFTLTRIYGFASMDNPYRVLLDIKKSYPPDKILGMVAFNQVLGTVIQENGRFVGLLHGDKQMSYSVVVKSGGQIYYGFVTNENFKTYVDFLPAYATLKAGDPVFTSGLDHIFSPNIYVGTIASVQDHYVYKKALLKIQHPQNMLFEAIVVAVP
ncbi:rod shape-determining protein MreC [Helicobacter ailurogastricus]|uniref:rod shape-determining protein MreC n=1 Tax=Helicobacter ailurogastricus TaxID=1578720 RepID=UPI0022C007C0|nr:rod shape-determining protein MreC [Helicobacter ailurogastricus]GLH58347.1 Rod shape-determining protein MreC [Helicobacter ailurogastricus]GLH59646.1 Rod shape-determining protein MreC [Helicobacter ailurogastricus]